MAFKNKGICPDISANEHAHLASCVCRACVLAADNKQECADCFTIMMKGSGVVGGLHKKYGRYYLGPPICGFCSNERYIYFLILMERYDKHDL